jgi:group I intron endonuclease
LPYKKISNFFAAYIITNAVTGKRYVGITTTSISQRWHQHRRRAEVGKRGQVLYQAMRKYGVAAFTIEHVASVRNLDDLNALEQDLILQEDTVFPRGYNLTWGGEFARRSEETCRRLSIALKGHPVSAAQRRKNQIGQTGRKLPLSTREAMSRSSPRRRLAPEHVAKLRAFAVQPKSAEHREKIRQTLLGSKLSPESIAKRTATRKRRRAEKVAAVQFSFDF